MDVALNNAAETERGKDDILSHIHVICMLKKVKFAEF